MTLRLNIAYLHSFIDQTHIDSANNVLETALGKVPMVITEKTFHVSPEAIHQATLISFEHVYSN